MIFKDEQQFQDTVESYLQLVGVKYYHTYRSTHSVSGYLDLTLVGRNGIMFRELKTETGSTSVEQDRWIAALREAGEDADVWRPSDWPVRIMAEARTLGRSSYAGEAEETKRARAMKKLRTQRRNARSRQES